MYVEKCALYVDEYCIFVFVVAVLYIDIDYVIYYMVRNSSSVILNILATKPFSLLYFACNIKMRRRTDRSRILRTT